MKELTYEEMNQIQGGDVLACVVLGAAEGAIVGAVYGSLFGPVGAAIGSFGWGVFYSMTANC